MLTSDSEKTSQEFTPFGIYKITENKEFSLPNIEIKFLKTSEKVFLYQRHDAEDNIIEKIIPTVSGGLDIEICPIRALNHPARRTDYTYLQFDKPVFLPEGASATIFLRCPIEIGIFLLHEGHKDSLDAVTCDPQNSRFALYGDPDSGVLCKHSTTPIVESHDDSIPYVNGVIKVDITNALEGGHSVNRIVFPAADNSIYYKDSKAIFDNIKAIMKKKLAIELIDVAPEKIQTDWTVSPTYEASATVKRLEMGLD